MAVRTITTRLTLDGEKQWKQEMADINSALKTQASELKAVESQYRNNANSMEALTAKNKVLTSQVEQQEEKVRKLEEAVKDAAEAFGESDTRTDRYRQSLNNARVQLDRLNDALQDNERELDDAKHAADDAADAVEDYGDKIGDADGKASGFGGSIDGLIGKLGGLKGLLVGGAIGAAVGAVKELAEGIMEIEESTREYRSIMGTLEVSSANAGYTTAQTEETFRQLQNVLGDTQTAATATANLQAIGLEQKELVKLTDAAIGAWATYGDSIPIDGLSESISKIAQGSTEMGVFADVLELAGISEDEFKAKLEGATTTTDRANLILETLAQQGLVDAAQGWRDVNADIVEANESQRKLDEAWGEMGEALAPVANFLRETLAGAVSWLAGTVKDLVDWLDKAIDKLRDIRDARKDWDKQVAQQYYGSYGNGYSGAGSGAYWDSVNGSHAGGLDYVPYDGYIAQLHKGERILTATEAQQRTLTEEGMGQMMVQLMNAVEGGTGPREVVLHVTTTLGGATVDEQIYRCNLRAQERHGEQLVKQ